MQETTLCSLLRLLAVGTMLTGAALTSYAVILLMGASQALQGASHALQDASLGVDINLSGMTSSIVSDMGVYLVLARLSVVAWGIVLYMLSPRLARRIAC